MRIVFHLVLIGCMLSFAASYSQTIKGNVASKSDAVAFANIVLEGLELGVSADGNGDYLIESVPLGKRYILVSAVGMQDKRLYVDIKNGINIIDIKLEVLVYDLDQVVVTATKTFKRRTDSPVIVNVIGSKQLQMVQACNLAEGLNFQSGVRVETDCQTCNYTQLRMNGLAGGYSQILINSKPIFSPLIGLYGMEQMPANMIDRIEVVRGGGSSLYGSSAIGGVVNIITKLPASNSYSFGYDYSIINNNAGDKVFYGNATVISDSKNSGIAFFVNNRNRQWYDHNGDNFSELPAVKDNSFGVGFFVLPSDDAKLQFNINSLYEYRYGGEMVSVAPHLAMQSEEREHDVLLGNIDYDLSFNGGSSSFSAYLAAQKTNRVHYTGIRPDVGTDEDIEHLARPPYGSSLNITKQAGLQFNHKVDRFLGSNLITVGFEYLSDDVLDKISAYNYLIDQKVGTFGFLAQSDWDVTASLNLLAGARIDNHSLLENIVLSPRISILYKWTQETQFRMSYSTGFRAPQAFDADMHIAFAGGGVSRIILDENLKQERSKSFSASVNYDRVQDVYIYGFTIEGFFTYLDDAFYQDFSLEDEFGSVFVKRNGDGAAVKGFTVEFRANLKQKMQLESGFTFQNSIYDEPVSYSNSLVGKREFLRTPEQYGYAMLSYKPSRRLSFSVNLVHTGSMDLVHLSGSLGQEADSFFKSPVFNAIGFKMDYVQSLKRLGVRLEYSFGVKNLTNAYQKAFDTLKYRDSNFIYGPSLPRTFYVGLVLGSL